MAAEIPSTYRTILIAEAAAAHRDALHGDEATFGPDVRELLVEGASLLATDYVLARRARRAFACACERLLNGFEFLAVPTTLVPAPRRGEDPVEVNGSDVPLRTALLSCTSPFSMIGLPAVSLPCGRTPEGLFVGLQIVGRRHRDLDVLALAEDFERLLGDRGLPAV